MTTTAAVPEFCLPGLVRNAVQSLATVVEHEPMAKGTWRMRLACPEIARQILPGQFFMIRMPGRSDPLLGRPFALYDVYGTEPEGIDFGYVVVGKMTSLFGSLKPGDRVELWGPLGNGFPAPPSGHLVIVAGGIGQTPFLAVIREALRRRTYGQPARSLPHVPDRITLCYGVRSREYLAGVDEFRNEGIDVRIATDDGSVGHHGFVTDLLKQLIAEPVPPAAVYCCGPEPMMHAVSKVTTAANVPCWLSLETPMACGFGACFSCVTKVRQDDGSWDYRRVCVEGPVFPASQIVFD
ncbi:MAG: dihydroorotate dehydrogenase electron transfer subunit [Planctomycetaceae bacterium]